MVMPAKNFVELKPEIPKRIVLTSWRWDRRAIIDPQTGKVSHKDVMVFDCIQEDGQPVEKTFSALAYKLQEQLAPHIESGQLFHRVVEITWRPQGYATDYQVGFP
jgi:hypothetical protein